jgi:hypothetical protein
MATATTIAQLNAATAAADAAAAALPVPDPAAVDSLIPANFANPDLMASIMSDLTDPNSVINLPQSPDFAASAAAASNADVIGDVYATFASEQKGPDMSQQNAIEALKAMFNAYGLGVDVSQAIIDMVKQGYTADTISLIAQDPTSTNPLALAMQARFPANKDRLAAGLAPLSPAEYMATERSYRQVLQASGLPAGFYDQHSDFTKFLSKDISPTELKTRVDLAASAIANADPFYVNALQQQYGLSTGDMIAHVLDPAAALPLLQKQATTVTYSVAAQRQGMNVDLNTANQMYNAGISDIQAQQGFRNIAGQIGADQALAARYNQYGPAGQIGAALESSTFNTPIGGETPAQAEEKLARLKTQEISSFSGSSGAGKGSLAGTEAGAS